MDENAKIIDALDQINRNYLAITDLVNDIAAVKDEILEETKSESNAVIAEENKAFDEITHNAEIDSSFIPVFMKRMDNTPGLDTYKEIEKWVSNNKSLFQEEDASTLIDGAKEFDDKYNSYRNQMREIEKSAKQEMDRIYAEAQKTFLDATTPKYDEIERLKSENEGFDILHEDYYYLAGDISKILRTRRAHNVRDALNLAIKEQNDADYRESQLKIQEQEAKERNRILKEQADAEREHQQSLERIQRENAYNMQRELQRQTDLMEKQAAEQRRQTEEMRKQADAAERARREAEKDRLQLQKDLDRATSQWRSYKSQGLEQDAIRWEAEIERIKGKLRSL